MKKSIPLYPIHHMPKQFTTILFLTLSSTLYGDIFDSLAQVNKVDAELSHALPFYYCDSLVGGYFRTPSARMAECGTFSLGFSKTGAYDQYSMNIQLAERLELAGSYSTFNGRKKRGVKKSFKVDPDRTGHARWALFRPSDGVDWMPEITLGVENSFGSYRFSSIYVVATKQWIGPGIELSLGWGNGCLDGPFAAALWAPFTHHRTAWLQSLSLIGEYSPIDVKKLKLGKKKQFGARINYGVAYAWKQSVRLQLSKEVGREYSASLSWSVPLGTLRGLFPKSKNPPYREGSFCLNGLALRSNVNPLYVEFENRSYRDKEEVKRRLLCACPNVRFATLFSDALAVVAYHNVNGYLRRIEVDPSNLVKSRFSSQRLITSYEVRPRVLTFFGSVRGRIRGHAGVLAKLGGELPSRLYYEVQASYPLATSAPEVKKMRMTNPSKLPAVRSDSLRYYRSGKGLVEKLYIQRGWNFGRGLFARASLGYFEPAFGGGALEFLWFPVDSEWGIGVEGALLPKRRISNLTFQRHIKRFKHDQFKADPFIPSQLFLELYYNPRWMEGFEWKLSVGQFLAHDKGVRLDMMRYFHNGVKFGLWYSRTDAKDCVDGRNYHDKGFFFSVPFDFFAKKSSRSDVSYAMSVWLRDVGARASTGRKLYSTIQAERR